MRKIIFTSFLFIFILVGCNHDAYYNAIQKGLDYIASGEYEKAEVAFELALEEKKQDGKATALLTQIRNYIEALDAYDQAKFELASKKANEVRSITDASDALITKAEELILAIEDLQTKHSELIEKYDMAMQNFEVLNYDEALATVDTILNEDLSHLLFHPLKNDTEQLQMEIEIALLDNEPVEVAIVVEKAVEDEKIEIEIETVTYEEPVKEMVEQEIKLESEKDKVVKPVTENENKANKSKIKLTPEDALTAIQNDKDWPKSTTFELEPNIIFFDGKPYYGIYVETPKEPGKTDLYLIDPTDGSVYNYTQGDLQEEYKRVS